jgi:hypothetical protein
MGIRYYAYAFDGDLTPKALPAIARDLGRITESDVEQRRRRIRYFGEGVEAEAR